LAGRYNPPSLKTIKRAIKNIDAAQADAAMCAWLHQESGRRPAQRAPLSRRHHSSAVGSPATAVIGTTVSADSPSTKSDRPEIDRLNDSRRHRDLSPEARQVGSSSSQFAGQGLLVESLPSALVTAMHAHNGTHQGEERIRLRMALHAGEVNYDAYGVTAAAVDLAFRPLDASALKAALAGSSGVLTVIASSWFFEEVVRHSAAGVAAAYRLWGARSLPGV